MGEATFSHCPCFPPDDQQVIRRPAASELEPAQHFRQGREPGTLRGTPPGGRGSLEEALGRPSGLGVRETARGEQTRPDRLIQTGPEASGG